MRTGAENNRSDRDSESAEEVLDGTNFERFDGAVYLRAALGFLALEVSAGPIVMT
jgi:hypothetical protein